MSTFDTTKKIKDVNPHADIDSQKGPYATIADALAATAGLREPGRTVKIITGGTTATDSQGNTYFTSGSTEEYWFKNGIADADLIPKQSEGFIPLTGTVAGSPVTGDIEFIDYNRIYANSAVDSGIVSELNFDDGNLFVRQFDTINNKFSGLSITSAAVAVTSNDTSSVGLTGTADFTANATGDLDYVQRKGIAAMIAGASSNLTTDNTLYISDSDVIGLNIAGSDNEYFTYSSSNVFTVANNIANLRAVFRNGVKLKLNTDYTLTLPKTITILSTLVSGEEINPVYEYIINT